MAKTSVINESKGSPKAEADRKAVQLDVDLQLLEYEKNYTYAGVTAKVLEDIELE